jgi:hypothetical protein
MVSPLSENRDLAFFTNLETSQHLHPKTSTLESALIAGARPLGCYCVCSSDAHCLQKGRTSRQYESILQVRQVSRERLIPAAEQAQHTLRYEIHAAFTACHLACCTVCVAEAMPLSHQSCFPSSIPSFGILLHGRLASRSPSPRCI